MLGFSASTYELLERPFAAVASNGITITRTGGSTGDVSVVFETNGGSAIPGVHFVPQSKRVHFPDGDSDPRVVDLGILPNDDNEPDTTVNVTLSQPGGCATLGAITGAVLTILDDDRPAPPPPPSGLDLTFDTDGKATTVFGGDDSAMALQSDGKIVMVGGSITDFVLARYNTDGSLDEDFGIGGRVTTPLATGIREEVARAVAIQRDGKIVVAGFLSIEGRPAGDRFDFALARYETNGTLDETFGIDGLALSNVKGRAFAVAIQGDDKIVVAGDSPLVEDIVVARYDADGTLDESFADFGIRITDLTGGGSDLASNLIIEPTGAILVSGPHTKAGERRATCIPVSLATRRAAHPMARSATTASSSSTTREWAKDWCVKAMASSCSPAVSTWPCRPRRCCNSRSCVCTTTERPTTRSAAAAEPTRRSAPSQKPPRLSRWMPTAESSSRAAARSRRTRTSRSPVTTRRRARPHFRH